MLLNPWLILFSMAALVAIIGFVMSRWPILKPKTFAIIFGLTFFIALVQFPPTMSKWSGEAAEITIAWGVTAPGMHGGILYDRDFDWPTGEALWVDVPAWSLHLLLFTCVLLCIVLDRRRLSSSRP